MFNAEKVDGIMIHSAMRKGLDSDWSVVAWNLINEMQDSDHGRKVWSFFCSWLQKQKFEDEVEFHHVLLDFEADADEYCMSILPSDRGLAMSRWWRIFRFLIKIIQKDDSYELYNTLDFWVGLEKENVED